MNKSIMMGRLVRDPEVRYVDTQKGEMAITNFRLAVDRKKVLKKCRIGCVKTSDAAPLCVLLL